MNIDKGVGMLVGLAIGDALGAPLEFEEPRHPDDYLISYTKGGAHNVSIGEWTDDTSMALAMAKSLLEKKSFDANDIMSKFCKWYKGGEFSPRYIRQWGIDATCTCYYGCSRPLSCYAISYSTDIVDTWK